MLTNNELVWFGQFKYYLDKLVSTELKLQLISVVIKLGMVKSNTCPYNQKLLWNMNC